MILNNTPVRTCKKFQINDIEFKEKVPNRISKFNNIKIIKETEKDEILENVDIENFELKYGTGLEYQIKEQANQKIKININSITNKEIRLEFNFDEKNKKLVDYVDIIGNEGTASNIYIVYRNSLCDELHSHCEDIHLKAQSHFLRKHIFYTQLRQCSYV